jgi:hypothetical protein
MPEPRTQRRGVSGRARLGRPWHSPAEPRRALSAPRNVRAAHAAPRSKRSRPARLALAFTGRAAPRNVRAAHAAPRSKRSRPVRQALAFTGRARPCEVGLLSPWDGTYDAACGVGRGRVARLLRCAALLSPQNPLGPRGFLSAPYRLAWARPASSCYTAPKVRRCAFQLPGALLGCGRSPP